MPSGFASDPQQLVDLAERGLHASTPPISTMLSMLSREANWDAIVIVVSPSDSSSVTLTMLVGIESTGLPSASAKPSSKRRWRDGSISARCAPRPPESAR